MSYLDRGKVRFYVDNKIIKGNVSFELRLEQEQMPDIVG